VLNIEAVLDNFTSVDGCGIIGKKPMSWAAEELEGADLGDKRRNRRLIQVVEDLVMQPNESVPQASRDTAAMQGIYEFWANPRIKASEILFAHTSSTVERIKGHSVVLGIEPSF
jgi:hypothetical protein